MATINTPLILAALGFTGLVVYSTRKKKTSVSEAPAPEPEILKYVPPPQEPAPHPDLPPAPTPEPPPKEPEPPSGGLEGKPWQPPPKEPVVPACKQSAQVYEGSMNLNPVLWSERGSQEMSILVPSADCDKYKLSIGICIQPVDYQLDPNVVILSEEIKAAFTDKEGQLAHAMNWNEFKAPAWKDIFDSTINYPIQGNLLLLGSEASENAMMPKACKSVSENWPTPQGAFMVHASDNSWKKWNPVPKFFLKNVGKNVKLKIEYSGFPYFQNGLARLDKKSTVKITYKIWHIGI